MPRCEQCGSELFSQSQAGGLICNICGLRLLDVFSQLEVVEDDPGVSRPVSSSALLPSRLTRPSTTQPGRKSHAFQAGLLFDMKESALAEPRPLLLAPRQDRRGSKGNLVKPSSLSKRKEHRKPTTPTRLLRRTLSLQALRPSHFQGQKHPARLRKRRRWLREERVGGRSESGQLSPDLALFTPFFRRTSGFY